MNFLRAECDPFMRPAPAITCPSTISTCRKPTRRPAGNDPGIAWMGPSHNYGMGGSIITSWYVRAFLVGSRCCYVIMGGSNTVIVAFGRFRWFSLYFGVFLVGLRCYIAIMGVSHPGDSGIIAGIGEMPQFQSAWYITLGGLRNKY